MMSQCMVPNWNLRHQRQEQVGGEEGNRSSHVNNQLQNHSRLFPMSSNYEVAELTWENGQLAMHELGGLLPTCAPTKQQTWGTVGTGDNTLESIVHQATTISQQQKQNQNIVPQRHGRKNISAAENNPSSTVASSAGKFAAKTSGLVKKRMRSESDQSGRNNNNNIIIQEEFAERSACASPSATGCRDNDTTVMTWASFESPRSLKTKATDEDSACHDESENLDEERETKEELTGRSHSTRRSRAAAIHNQSERRRRDRINQRMKALQKLVPNASKSDKASILDEVIDYLKQLQAQLRMMMMSNNARSMHLPPMMMPMGIQAQQQIQMSMQLARMGMGIGPGSIPMGMGIGMGIGTGMGTGIPQSLPQVFHHPPPFVVPPMIPNHTPPQPQQPTTHQDAAAISNSFPFNHPYYAFLAQQSMNMDLCNKMAEIYRQQVSQSTTPPRSKTSPSSHAQRG